MVFPVLFPCLSVRKRFSSSSGTACQEVSYLFLLAKAFLSGRNAREGRSFFLLESRGG